MAFLKELKKEDSIKLYKYSGKDLKLEKDEALIDDKSYVRVCFVDLETTGLDFVGDEIIEIGIKTVAINKADYSDFKAIKAYESYQDTEIEISSEITQLTGISKDIIET